MKHTCACGAQHGVESVATEYAGPGQFGCVVDFFTFVYRVARGEETYALCSRESPDFVEQAFQTGIALKSEKDPFVASVLRSERARLTKLRDAYFEARQVELHDTFLRWAQEARATARLHARGTVWETVSPIETVVLERCDDGQLRCQWCRRRAAYRRVAQRGLVDIEQIYADTGV